MEGFFVLLGIGYLLVLPILTLGAWFRTSNHTRQIEELRSALQEVEARNAKLNLRLDRLLERAPREAPAPQPSAPAAEEAAEPRPVAAQAIVIKQPAVSVSVAPALTAEARPPLPQAAQPRPAAIAPAVPPQAPRAPQAPITPASAPPAADDTPALPTLPERAIAAAKEWLLGGNSLVRIGMLLVFLGLAFLLRYASDRIVIPLEARYLGVALTALVALALGWRLRSKRRAYGLLMQGGAVGVMYLTVFAALKLHGQPLLSTEAGFALMVAVVALSGVLAVAQDALSLAVAGALGGFAAPVLISTGGGNHVALFSYFALLNAGILGIAWFKAWRPLNLAGFFGTFLIGLAWGLRDYDPLLHYASTQPFLILLFLMFVAIGLLFARRMLLDDPDAPATRDTAAWTTWLAKHSAQRYVDGTLLFGVPVVGFGLQYGLIRHLEYGTAFSALALGAFYLVLARLTHTANPLRHRLLTEVFLALGMIFASLAIPLGLDAQWTTAAWALEGAGIYWIGHRQARPLARGFALLLQAGAAIAFVQRLAPGSDTVLDGSALGALLLGLSFLANRQALPWVKLTDSWDRDFEPLFGTLGLWSLYAIAPLQLSGEHTAAAWAVAGMLTVFAGLRLNARAWVANALLVQLFAGLLFLHQMHVDGAGGAALLYGGSGLHGLIVASLIGFASLAGIGAAVRAARREEDAKRAARLAWAMLFGLGFVSLAVLFVLPWQTAAAAWAACGFALLWAALRLGLKPAFWFALVLEVVSGIAFFTNQIPALPLFKAPFALEPFAHAGFWTPVALALAAFAVAWRLHAYARAARDDEGLIANGAWLSFTALLWSAWWWVFAWHAELMRIEEANQPLNHHFLAVMAASALLLLPIAAKWRWARLAGVCGLLLPLVALVGVADYRLNSDLLAGDGWAAYGLALLAGFGLLRIASGLLAEQNERLVHLVNTWVWLGAASLELRYLFLSLGEPGSTWRWLGWVLPLAFWLLWSARSAPPRLWPAAAHPQLYRFQATAPLLGILLAWLAMANVYSAGNAEPLPFIPLLNPLDLALLLVLFGGWQWRRQLAAQEAAACPAQRLHEPFLYLLLGGAFLTYTCAVLRGAHHLAEVAWQFEAMMHSMLVQASLSLAWALLALGLMIAGHRMARRAVWIAGAALVAVVVAKLFLIELSNRGGLERIVSFLGVGVLLLVVGYYAPLPPSRDRIRDEEPADATAN